MSNVLVLSVRKKWFDLIKSGEKKEEYRELSMYWRKRLGQKAGYYKGHKFIEFRNGYGRNVPNFKVELLGIEISTPNPKWVDDEIGDKCQNCFVLRLGRILPCA